MAYTRIDRRTQDGRVTWKSEMESSILGASGRGDWCGLSMILGESFLRNPIVLHTRATLRVRPPQHVQDSQVRQ